MNPEFVRNLWLETTPRRIGWAAAAVLLVLFASAVLFGRSGGPLMGPTDAVGVAGVLIYFSASQFWGVREARRAVLVEIGERTWDFQRLSALTPWTMTWGKLFGATSLAWLTALAGLIAALPGLAQHLSAAELLEFILGALALGLLTQAASLAGSLVTVRKARAEGRLAAIRGGIGGFFSGLVFLWLVAKGLSLAFVMARSGAGDLDSWKNLDPHQWWGLMIGGGAMIALSLVVYAAWAVTATWRLMRLELQMQNSPWVWTGFLVFTALFLAGFAGASGIAARFALMAGVFAAGAYAGAFVDPADRVSLRQFAAACGARDMSALRRTPLALPPAILALIAVIAFALSPTVISADGSAALSPAFGIATLAFLLRDLGVICYFRFGPRPKRGDLGAVLALFLLYGVGGALGHLSGPLGLALFVPDNSLPLISFGSAAVQALIAWVLATQRVRRPEAAAG